MDHAPLAPRSSTGTPRPRRPGMAALALALALGSVLALAACGGNDDSADTRLDVVVTTDAPATTGAAPPTLAPVTQATSEPGTSAAADTTAAPTTDPPATTTPATAAPTDPAPAPTAWEPWTGTFVPIWCCGANRIGPASPPLAPEGEPLADGRYAAELVEWSAAAPDTMTIAVSPFVPCADGVTDCSPTTDGGGYAPGEIGIGAERRTMELPLDGSVGVVVAGIDPEEPSTTDGEVTTLGVTERADGAALATLLGDLTAAYDEHIGSRIAAGEAASDVVADLQADPRGGFTSAAEEMLGELFFHVDPEAPGLLLQSVTTPSVDLPDVVGIDVEDGATTVFAFAAFRS